MWVVCRAACFLVGSSDFLEFARQRHSNGKTANPTNKPLYNNNRSVQMIMMMIIIIISKYCTSSDSHNLSWVITSFLSSHYDCLRWTALMHISAPRCDWSLLPELSVQNTELKTIFDFSNISPLRFCWNRLQSALRSVTVGGDGGFFPCRLFFFSPRCQITHVTPVERHK